ncbi:MAG: protein-export chaperone SecB [Alphaproteobacteria bacterium]|nr:protein-export chaperone SecB [Alphaproteobacteria bacterium]
MANETSDENEKKALPEKKPEQQNVAKPNDKAGLPGQPIIIRSQYLKDLSFENPNAPHIYAQKGQPEIALSINIDANELDEKRFTVTLTIKCEASIEKHPQFIAELVYEAVIEMNENLDAKYYQPILMVEAPRFIFPFARNILANAASEGGFPPLFLQPIDFAALYRDKLKKTIDDASDNLTEN